MYHIEAAETMAINPQMVIFEWKGSALPER